MYSELVDEVEDAQRSTRHSTKETIKLRQHAAEMLTKLAQRKVHVNNLTDELRDEQVRVQELEDKVAEYEAVIDYMSQEMLQQEEEHKNIMDYIDHVYTKDTSLLIPNFIAKYSVPNKNTTGKIASVLCIATFNLPFSCTGHIIYYRYTYGMVAPC